MLTFDTILVALPTIAGGLALLGYAGLIWQRRNAQQSKAKPKPVPVSSRRRRDTQE
jgi:hypothetical protein